MANKYKFRHNEQDVAVKDFHIQSHNIEGYHIQGQNAQGYPKNIRRYQTSTDLHHTCPG